MIEKTESSMNIYKLAVHPAADVFPMIDDDELAELASDIKENGQRHPIIIGMVDGDMMLIDGRNRLAACKLAGVEPAVEEFTGSDPESLILSENIMRRHLTKGQRAMAVAMMYPEGSQGKRSNLYNNNTSGGITKQYLSFARTVLRYAPELVEPVKVGAKSLASAYEEAKARQSAGSDDAERLASLKAQAPDLADKVVEGELTLAGAIAEHKERERIARANRTATQQSCRDGILTFGGMLASSDRIEKAVEAMLDAEYETVSNKPLKDSVASLKTMSKNIHILIEKLES